MNLKDSILKTLREEYLLAAGAMAIYPEGSMERIRAEHAAANTSLTVFKLYGDDAVDALREEALTRWPKLGGK